MSFIGGVPRAVEDQHAELLEFLRVLVECHAADCPEIADPGVEFARLHVTADHATGIPRFSPSAVFAIGEVPFRTGSGIPYSWTYAGGSVSYSTGGHGNELVTVAARGDRASGILEALVGKGRAGTRILDDTDIYLAIRGFAGL